MSSDNSEEFASGECSESTSQLIPTAGAVAVQPVPPQLETLTLLRVPQPQPPPLPPRSSLHPLSPYSSQPSLKPLPPFSPLNPLPSLSVPELQTDPFVTPDLSPVRNNSVIYCPSSCEGLQYHQTPVHPIQPDLLQLAHQLGDKLLDKYRQKIHLVSTSVSSLEPDFVEEIISVTAATSVVEEGDTEDTFEVFDHTVMSSNSSGEATVIMDTTSRDLRKKLQLVRNHIGDFLEDDVDEIRVPIVERDLKEIQEERDEFRSSVEDFLEDYADQLETAAQTSWRDSVAAINLEVKAHAKKIRAKVNQVCPQIRPLSMFEKTQLDIQMRQLSLMEAKASKDHDASTHHSSAEKTKVLALAKKKFDAFFEDSGALADISSKYPAETLADLE